jgi:anti-sigma factor RsiW
MNHQEERLSAYVDGELLADEIVAVEQHLHECASCSDKVDALRRLGTLLSTIPEREPSPQFLPGLMNRIRHERKVIRFVSATKLAILAAAAVILFVVLILKMQQEAGQTHPGPTHRPIVAKPHVSPPVQQKEKKETVQAPVIAKVKKQEKEEKPPQLTPEKPEQTVKPEIPPEEQELSNEEVEMIANLDVLENMDVITNYESLENLDVALMTSSEESKQ